MNRVILIGRLTRDPELSYTPSNQTAVTRFTLAVDRPVMQGRERQADFIRITVWGKQAETCERYLSKGRQVAVEGRIQTGSYKNRAGETVYTTDVVADRVEFIGSASQNDGGASRDGYGNSRPAPAPAQQSPSPSYSGGYGSYNDYNDVVPDSFEEASDEMPF